jgi:ubiquinone/menaquinone biosynthesis C-methylase UbiE
MTSTDKDSVRSYYASFGEREWQRLEQPADGAIEFALTTAKLDAHLQPASRVLDIGGGPGRYAIWLAQQGHTVALADLSPELLEIARARITDAGVQASVVEIIEADACDLSRWPDASFDAALSLGPFYHLTAASDRSAAANELARVLKPGGVAFIALMPRYAFIRRTFCVPNERHHLLDREWLGRLVEEGVFENDVAGRFTSGYGFRPEEIEPFFASHGLDQIELLAAESLTAGLAHVMGDLIEQRGEVFESALPLLLDAASDPSLLGAASHLLLIARRH